MTDRQLLRQFVKERSQQAFTDLVRRHIDVVYSAARRQTRGDAQLAEEVTQQAFILLAQKAATLKDDVLLGGWLFNTVRFIARDAVRKEDRRALHEQKAAQMAQQNNPPQSTAHDAWKDAEIVLDEAMADLEEPTRGLLVLRFFEGKTAREVGERLGISEDAARKRISRAVDELRELFGRRGVVMSSAVLGDALIAHAVVAAPEGLAVSAATAATATTAGTVSVNGGVAALLLAGKAKVVAAIAAGAVVIVGGTQVVQHLVPAAQTETIKVPAAAQITGTIRDPRGNPVKSAQILVGSETNVINSYSPPARRPRATTDADGKFALPKPKGSFTIVARSEFGYAQRSSASLEKSSDVTLQPWGKIEGTLLAGSKPVANAMVRLWAPSGDGMDFPDPVYHQTDVKTDANGKFVFPMVAPGEVWLADLAPDNSRMLRRHYLIVEPGKTAQVTFGGSGRAVVGKILVDRTGPIWSNGPKFLYDSEIRPYPIGFGRPTSRPVHVPAETPEEYRAKEVAFGATESGREFKKWWLGWNFMINPDGAFRIDDVPPGKYYLSVRNMELLKEVSHWEDWANARLEFTVPATDAKASDQPIDVGEIKMETVTYLKPGDACTPFEFTTFDGRTHNITAFRGKHVLMISWYSQGDRQELDRLKAIQKKWRDDPRLAIVWLAIDPEPAAKEASAKEGIAGIVGSTSGRQVPREYGAAATSSLLIGSDGKLVQKHLHRDNMDRFLAKSLGKPQPVTPQGQTPTAPVLQTTPAP